MTLSKFGRYEITGVLPQGGMAEVYKAHDPVIDRQVALKIIRRKFSEDPRFKRRFRREANIIANLEHRAILPVYDFGEDEKTGQLYLVMRLMPDVLNFRIERDGPISLEETSLILNRLAAALAKAHQRDIVHRDIKPANILLDSDGTTFLSDFGLAAFAAKIETSSVPSSYGGSPFYMAPEQWLDEKVGPHTDVYQLGVTLFEMLTGERPFPESDMQVLLDRHTNAIIPNARDINPKLPRNIEPILAKAMAKNPLDRYATPLELAKTVANLLRPERIKNRYEIKEELQHGRLAVVYLARDLFEDRDVALKILKHKLIRNQAFQQRFQQQQEIITSIQHTAVVPVYNIDQHKGRPYLAMRFMEGASLRERFRKKKRTFSVESVCELAGRLAESLDAIHDAGKTHGDINLGNVLLDVEGHCYLTDFHITRVAELTEAVVEQEAHLGYLPYLAPEQWQGEVPTAFTDVYQFGMMLFELFTGQRPFADESGVALRHHIENEPLPKATTLNKALPPQFNAILARAMAKRSQDRFDKASELVLRLNQAREEHAFETFKQQGDDCYKEKQWDQAIAAYTEALEIRPYDSAVRASVDRAEKRKLDSGIFHRGQFAIEEERWEDAVHYLQQIPETPETNDLLEYVQQKILIERQYDEGKAAMLRQEWVVARGLLDETDRLEPNYKDVNRLLGQLESKISEIIEQAQSAIDEREWDKALSFLSLVDGDETAVALRETITAEQRENEPVGWWTRLSQNKKAAVIVTVVLLSVFTTVFAFFPEILNSGNVSETTSYPLSMEDGLACLGMATPRLQAKGDGNFETVLAQESSENIIPDDLQDVKLSLLWNFEDDSQICPIFIAEDGRLSTIWETNNGSLDPNGTWDATYQRLSLSESSDTIIITLLFEDQPFTYSFQLYFEP